MDIAEHLKIGECKTTLRKALTLVEERKAEQIGRDPQKIALLKKRTKLKMH